MYLTKFIDCYFAPKWSTWTWYNLTKLCFQFM